MSNQQSNQNQNEERAPLIPEGRYKAKCVDHKFGRAGTGTEQIGVLLEIQDDGPLKGRTIMWYGFFTPDAEERTIKSMRALGWQGTAVSKMETMYTGIAQVVVEHEEDQQGVMRAKAQWVNAIGVIMKDSMNAAELASFGKRIAGVAARIGGGPAPSTASGPPQSRRDDRGRNDDPPFPTDEDAPPQRPMTRYSR